MTVIQQCHHDPIFETSGYTKSRIPAFWGVFYDRVKIVQPYPHVADRLYFEVDGLHLCAIVKCATLGLDGVE